MSNKQDDLNQNFSVEEEESKKINYTDFLRDTEAIEAELRKEAELKRQKRIKRVSNAANESTPEDDIGLGSKELIHADKIKKRTIAALAAIAAVIIIYFLAAYGYYGNKFLPSTIINGELCSGKTPDEVSDIMAEKVLDYHLSIKYNDITVDELYGRDIDLEFGDLDKALEEICHKQNKLSWLKCLFIKPEAINTTKGLTYNAAVLNRFINSSLVLSMTGTKESEDAKLEYSENKFIIIPEVQGDRIDHTAFSARVTGAVTSLDPELNINTDDCFIKPVLTADNKNLIMSCKEANKLIKDTLTLNVTDDVFEIPADIKAQWLCVDGLGNLMFDNTAFSKYMDKLDKSYSTNTEVRQFKTFHGDEVTVTGGDYGTGVARENLSSDMESAMLNNGDDYVIVEFEVFQKDIGDSYIEVDLSNQMLWMYVEGELILSTPVITGRDDREHLTSEGVYRLKSKKTDDSVIEKGESHTVKYFMAVNGNMGICDADWKNLFGGQIYKTEGSDGSVYVIEESAKTIYENCYENMPVIYYNHGIVESYYIEDSYMSELMALIENSPEIPTYTGEYTTEETTDDTEESEENTEDESEDETEAPLVDSIINDDKNTDEEDTLTEDVPSAEESDSIPDAETDNSEE